MLHACVGMDQNLILLGITSSLLIVFGAVGTLFRYRTNEILYLADWFVAALVGYGGFAMLTFIGYLAANPDARLLVSEHSTLAWIYPVLCCLVIVGTWLSIWAFNPADKLNPLNQHWAIVPPLMRYQIVAVAMLVIGLVSYWLYARSYGGFSQLLAQAAGIRAGLVDVGDNPYTFLKRFGGFVFFSVLIFSGIILTKSKGALHSVLSWSGFSISFAVSLFILYSWEGRLGLVMFLLIVPLGYLLHKSGPSLKTLRRSLLLVIIPAIVLPASSAIWGKSSNLENVGAFFVKELSCPVVSLTRAHETNSLRYMKDILAAPAYLFPTRVWQGILGLDTATDVNTRNIIGVSKGERGSTTAAPVDIVTFSFMQAHYLGAVIVGFLIGAVLCRLDVFIARHFYGGTRAMLLSYSVLFVATNTVLYGDPKHIIVRNFHFIIGIVLLWWLARRDTKTSHATTLQSNPIHAPARLDNSIRINYVLYTDSHVDTQAEKQFNFV